MWAGAPSTLPTGWLVCDGYTYNISDYPALATVLGVKTGTTFTTPNFQSRVPVGVDGSDTDFKPEGVTGGAKTVARWNCMVTHLQVQLLMHLLICQAATYWAVFSTM